MGTKHRFFRLLVDGKSMCIYCARRPPRNILGLMVSHGVVVKPATRKVRIGWLAKWKKWRTR